MQFEKNLSISKCNIPDMLIFDLPVHGDNRGWFKENWQRCKMMQLGLPDFNPVQNNISFNTNKGTTRGIHAEPWDKFISVAHGSIFGAWVDLREGDSFGKTFTTVLDSSKAIFVPRGVGNSFQTLENNTIYTYLVNDHWSDDAQKKYTFLNLSDPKVNINWPINLHECNISEKDKKHPFISDVTPMASKKILILGASGQLGKALIKVFPDADFADRERIDISNYKSLNDIVNWKNYKTIINAAAYTNVDLAETSKGRLKCWATNATSLAYLANISNRNNITLIHISSDYVFDGTSTIHTENEQFSPLNVYGQSKAAGDISVLSAFKHYIIRTSWVIGQGKNFINTMINCSYNKESNPSVINDQIGRLSFTEDIAFAIKHLINMKADYGVYNVSSDGNALSWSKIAKKIFKLLGDNPQRVREISTQEYLKDKPNSAKRPLNSLLSLDKLKKTGFTPRDQEEAIEEYISKFYLGDM